MRKLDWTRFRNAFLRWKGWYAIPDFCRNVWQMICHWKGWKSVFCLPLPLVLLLGILCAAAMIWIFARGFEQWVPAYFLYALSAYLLTALCVKLPSTIRDGRQWLNKYPGIAGFLQDKEAKFKLELYYEQLLNFGYGIFKIISGVVYGSAWIGADGIYNFAQALIQLFQILRRRKAGSLEQQWRSYRFCGVLILLMHLTLTGIVFQMVNWNRAEEQGEIMVIATAAFAFFKFISSFWDIARDRKHARPVDSSIRMLNLAQAIFAVFSLQASMFHTFGTGESWEHLLNLITGSVACLLIAAMGIYMIRRGNREIKGLQETNDGE